MLARKYPQIHSSESASHSSFCLILLITSFAAPQILLPRHYLLLDEGLRERERERERERGREREKRKRKKEGRKNESVTVFLTAKKQTCIIQKKENEKCKSRVR